MKARTITLLSVAIIATLLLSTITFALVSAPPPELKTKVWWSPKNYTLDNPVPDPWQAVLFGAGGVLVPVTEMDPATILLEGMFTPLGPPNEPYLTFHDLYLVVSFDGYDVLTAILLKAGHLIPGENNRAELEITGQTYEGRPFSGTGKIQMYVPEPPPP